MRTTEKKSPSEYPQVRPGAGGLRLAHRPAAGSPAAAMAASILRRYTPSGEWGGFPEQVLRETPPMAVTQQTTHRVQLHFAPQLALNAYLQEKRMQVFTARLSPEEGSAETGGGAPAEGLTVRQERLSVLVERLAQRGVRIEGQAEDSARSGAALAAVPGRSPAAAPPLTEIVPVRRVFQHPASTPPAAAPQPSGEAAVTASSSRSTQPPKTAEAAHSLASLDINQLTEQVVRTIDRRITAQRERLGRL